MDTITEFSNLTGKTFAELSSGVALAAMGANEQAVIRDITISSQNKRSLELVVGSAVVGSTYGSAKATGTELLGQNTQLSLRTNEKPLFNGLLSASPMSSGVYTFEQHTNSTIFSENPTETPKVSYRRSLTVTSTTRPVFMCVSSSTGDVFIKYESDNNLYRRASGIGGTQTSVSFAAAALCYDGIRYIYGVGGNQLFIYDTTNAQVTQRTMSGYDPGTFTILYTSCCAIDGWVLVRQSSDSTSTPAGRATYLVNAISGVRYNFAPPSGIDIANTALTMAAVKDKKGNYVFAMSFNGIMNGATGEHLFCWSPGKVLGPNPVIVFTKNIFISNVSAIGHQLGNLHRPIGVDGYILGVHGGRVGIFDITEYFVAASHVLPGISIDNGLNGRGFTFLNDSAAAAVDFGTVDVRTTGIKSTA